MKAWNKILTRWMRSAKPVKPMYSASGMRAWRVLASQYDDGGFQAARWSGPHLKRLLDDIDKKRIQAVNCL